MSAFVSLVIFTATVAVCQSNNEVEPLIEQKSLIVCSNEIYRIPILSMHTFRIPFNQTLLVQNNITSLHVLARTADEKVLQFDNDTDVTIIKVNLTDNNLRKF